MTRSSSLLGLVFLGVSSLSSIEALNLVGGAASLRAHRASGGWPRSPWAALAQAELQADVSKKEGPGPGRSRTLLDRGWKFLYQEVHQRKCDNTEFSQNLQGRRCAGLTQQAQVTNEWDCRATCCNDPDCDIYQWCPADAANCTVAPATCWTGRATLRKCRFGAHGLLSRGRTKTSLLQQASIPIGRSKTCEHEYCKMDFNEKDWNTVSLPHDFALLGKPNQEKGTKTQGYLPSAKGWYRLRFTVPAEAAAGVVWLDFDGVQRTSAVYLNGRLLGYHYSGYTPFRYDISSVAKFGGGENVLAVLVDATWPDGWWYDGGGIYRHVWLNVANRVHVAPFGVYLPASVTGPVKTEQGKDAGLVSSAEVTASTLVLYQRQAGSSTGDAAVEVKVQSDLFGPDGQPAGRGSTSLRLRPGEDSTASVKIQMKEARLWSLEHPRLYSCNTTLWVDGALTDAVTDTFGIRKMEWTKKTGFFLNDQPVKIKGMANHQDFAGVGVAVPDSLQAYRVWTHKEMGANAWRTAHNPPTSALLDEADRQGMLVWNENHRNRGSEEAIEELRALLLRDRNHPSVFMWALCNEALCENFDAATVPKLRQEIRELDPDGQRKVTAAVNFVRERNDLFSTQLDVIGINYQIDQYDVYNERHPDQLMIASETSSDTADRGIYFTHEDQRIFLSNGGDSLPRWGASAEDAWCNVANRSHITGAFYWTGFDYRGEPTPNEWPNVLSHFGIMDLAGFPKDKFFYHQSVFLDANERPMLHILPHWNWGKEHGLECDGFCHLPDFKNGKRVDVWAYTNGDEVELFLNNASQGRQKVTPCRHVAWSVPYRRGELRAVAFRGGKVISEERLRSTGHAEAIAMETAWPLARKLRAVPRAAGGDDVALITVKLVDSAGDVVPTASAPLSFSLEGPGRILGFGNGDPTDHDSDLATSPTAGKRKAWNGLARVVLQTTGEAGELTLTAKGQGLRGTSLKLTVE